MDSRRLDIRHTFDSVIAASGSMREVMAVARRLAADTRPLFVDGETGTGRKFMARVLHQESPRCAHPMVVVRSDMLAVNVMDRMLFGDERSGVVGKFDESADGTLLFIDVEALSPVSQERLYKVLKDGRYMTAECESRYITSRVIATGNRIAIDRLTKTGHFSEPLLAYLSETTLRMPSLSERHADIPELVVTVLRELSGREHIETPSVPYHYMELLMSVAWPENIRQLRNHIESVMVLSGGDFNPEIIREHFVPEGTPGTIKGAFQTILGKLRGAPAEPVLAANHSR